MKVSGMTTITVFGGGTMGEGIGLLFAMAGTMVRVVDEDGDKLNRCQSAINKYIRQMDDHGMVKEPVLEVTHRISFYTSQFFDRAVTGAELIIETIPESLQMKKDLLARLDQLPADVIIASNTGSISITQLSEEMKTPTRVIGTHFFNPAYLIPLVEVHRGENTSHDTLEKTLTVLRAVGKIPIVLKNVMSGFIALRVVGAMMREIYHLIDEGVASPAEIDLAIKNSIGMKMAGFGPLEMEDMAGLDIASKAYANIFPTLSNSQVPTALLSEKTDRGELGYKTGRGWLDYDQSTGSDIELKRNLRLIKQLKVLPTSEKK